MAGCNILFGCKRLGWMVVLGGVLISGVNSVLAQVVPDTTLPVNSSVSAIGNNFTVTNGTAFGGNLFHSFSQFSVPINGSAFFNINNNPAIQNIISRVTGSSLSDIDGLIRANGTANLFLINPNGIVFRENARLQVGGSFVASTANAIQFGDRGFFSATNPQAPSPLLSINPSALLFNQLAARIENRSRAAAGRAPDGGNTSGLRVPDGRSLLLAGGDIKMDGGRLRAFGGRVELGGLAAPGTVGLQVDGNNLRLGFPENVARSDVSFTNGASVRVDAAGGGDIAVNARNFEMLGGSFLSGGIGQGLGSANSKAGNIEINAQEAVNLNDGSFIENYVGSRATGQGGDININARGKVSFDGGNSGNISGLFSTVSRLATGNAGNIKIQANSISLNNNAVLSGSNSGTGNAGNIDMQAQEAISLANGSLIVSNIGSPARQPAKGNVGNILLDAKTVSLTGGSQLQAGLFTGAEGNAGLVSIMAKDSVSFTGRNSGIFTDVESRAVGNGSDIKISAGNSVSLADGAILSASNAGERNGGKINIDTERFSVTNGSSVLTNTSGVGNAGDIFIKAGLVEVLGTEEVGGSSGISADVGGTGNAGNLTIDTRRLVIRSSQVSSTTFGKGNAGDLTVNASESVEIFGKVFGGTTNKPINNPAGLFAQVNTEGEGKGGNLTVITPRLSIGGGSKVQVATFGKGDAGNLFIRANDIDIFDTANADFFQGGIFAGVEVDVDETETPPTGNGGTLTIEGDRITVRDGGLIFAGTEGNGNGGTLKITANDFLRVFGTSPNGKFKSKITAEAASTETTGGGIARTIVSNGNAGDLTINTRQLTVSDGGEISVGSEGAGTAGKLTINARSITLDNRGSIIGTTTSGNGGDITLNVQDLLLLRRNSFISSTAGGAGNGGNITINTPNGFIVGVRNENSDITANAFTGSGGKVDINATDIYFLAPLSREDLQRLRPLDRDPRQLQTNDITAISRENPNLSGQVNINITNVDANQGLTALPASVVDPSMFVASGCAVFDSGSTFTATGRGGLPPSPDEPLTSDAVWSDTRSININTSVNVRASASTSSAPKEQEVLPATGWVFDGKGNVTLVTHARGASSYSLGSNNGTCPGQIKN